MNFDTMFKDARIRIHKINTDVIRGLTRADRTSFQAPMAGRHEGDFSQGLETTTRFRNLGSNAAKKEWYGSKIIRTRFNHFVDASFFEMFGLDLLVGIWKNRTKKRTQQP